MAFFNLFKKNEKTNNHNTAENHIIEVSSLKKPIVPEKMFTVFQAIDEEGILFFLATYDKKEKEFMYSLSEYVFEYLGEFLILNKDNIFVDLDKSGVDMRLIKASIQINFIKAAITGNQKLIQSCAVCVANLGYPNNLPATDEGIALHTKWYSDWTNKVIEDLKTIGNEINKQKNS